MGEISLSNSKYISLSISMRYDKGTNLNKVKQLLEMTLSRQVFAVSENCSTLRITEATFCQRSTFQSPILFRRSSITTFRFLVKQYSRQTKRQQWEAQLQPLQAFSWALWLHAPCCLWLTNETSRRNQSEGMKARVLPKGPDQCARSGAQPTRLLPMLKAWDSCLILWRNFGAT